MPFLQHALDPDEVEREIGPLIERRQSPGGRLRLHSIRVTRHKPGRRCLIEYQFRDTSPRTRSEVLTLLGKARAKSLDLTGFQTTRALWESGFNLDAPDGVMVPEPVGTVPAFQMWLQRKAPGVVATKHLPTSAGFDLTCGIALAALKLHRSGIVPDRTHTPADEMQILDERLTRLAAERPALSSRITRVLHACRELASRLPDSTTQPIHRDFYPDQVLVDGSRLYLLDLDLCAAGDPALDIGNFRGHLIEQSLRSFNRPDAFSGCEQALTQAYCSLSGQDLTASIDAYTTLTVARHIAISTLFPERHHLTETLIDICEHRLGLRRNQRTLGELRQD